MLNPETFALQFARALYLFRTQASKEEQKQQFRVLVGVLKDGGVLMRITDGRLYVNGTAVEVPQVAPLRDRLELHAVSEVAIPRDAPVSHIYELLTALSDISGADTRPLTQRLRDAGADRVSVSLTALDYTPSSRAPQPPVPPPAHDASLPAELASQALGADGLLRGDPMKEYGSAPVEGTSDIVREESESRADGAALPARGSAEAPSVPRAKSTDDVLAELEAHPATGTLSDTLAVLSRQIESALLGDRVEEALRIVDGIIRIEASAPEGSRRSYAIALKRVFTKPLLESFARLAAVPQRREAALRAVGRGGEEGVEILLDLLANAPSIDERRNLFAAVSQIKKGQDQLIHMLGHHQWFVVRNVAELLGELGLEGSADALSRQLAHPDERVRGAVALALAKIGTAGAVEPLRRALRDPTVGVRLQVALGVSGRKAGALAMPIVVAIDQEQDPDVARELMLALGRIGSPDAVQALIKFAQPGGRLFGRKPAPRRMAAVEALRVAATPAAIGTLQGLAEDSDKEVKSAARAALAELKR